MIFCLAAKEKQLINLLMIRLCNSAKHKRKSCMQPNSYIIYIGNITTGIACYKKGMETQDSKTQ